MPKYYCDYCDTYLTHDSPSVRKTHCGGRFHRENVRKYYQEWLEKQVQKLVNQTTDSFTNGRMQPNPNYRKPQMMPQMQHPSGIYPRPLMGQIHPYTNSSMRPPLISTPVQMSQMHPPPRGLLWPPVNHGHPTNNYYPHQQHYDYNR